MQWADYRDGSKKAKAHFGFDINHTIPSAIFLTDGKGDERPFVSQILSPGQTGIMDRGYQCHKDFDRWQHEKKHYICRIKKSTKKSVIQVNAVNDGSIAFYDATVLLGTPNLNQTGKSAEDIASGKAKEEFDSQKMRNDFHEMQDPQNDNKPPDLKEDFDNKKEDRTYRYINDNRETEKDDSQENDSDMKKDFNKSRFLPDHQEQEKDRGRFTNRDTDKDTSMEHG